MSRTYFTLRTLPCFACYLVIDITAIMVFTFDCGAWHCHINVYGYLCLGRCSRALASLFFPRAVLSQHPKDVRSPRLHSHLVRSLPSAGHEICVGPSFKKSFCTHREIVRRHSMQWRVPVCVQSVNLPAPRYEIGRAVLIELASSVSCSAFMWGMSSAKCT